MRILTAFRLPFAAAFCGLLFTSVQLLAQSVTYIDYGGKIPQENPFDVRFEYTTSVACRAAVSIKKPSEAWRTYATTTVNIPAGTKLAKSVTLRHSATPALGTGYVVEVKMLNATNDTQLAYLSANVSVAAGKQGFHVYQGDLYNSRKDKFLIRGINNAHADYDNYGRDLAFNALTPIKARGFNAVRIQWRTRWDDAAGAMTTAQLDKIIASCIAKDMVPIVQLHDATGSANSADLQAMAQWWANNVWLLVKYRAYIIVNIANEWSPHGTSGDTWFNAYKTAIQTIRNAGYSGCLMIDAPAYAQDPVSIRATVTDPSTGTQMSRAALLTKNDPVGNLIFSLHMYVQWADTNTDYYIDSELTQFRTLKIPVVVGEFARNHPDNAGTNRWIDIWQIMRSCKTNAHGYMGWSWYGNGSYVNSQGQTISLAALNIATDWAGTNLTSGWGTDLVGYTGYGIASTSVLSTALTTDIP